MNNGLRGRYLDQLEAWNNARQFAADLIAAYYDSGLEIHDVVARWNQENMRLPNLSDLKRMVNNVLFESSRNAIDEIASSAIRWRGWNNVEPPVRSAGQTVPTRLATV